VNRNSQQAISPCEGRIREITQGMQREEHDSPI